MKYAAILTSNQRFVYNKYTWEDYIAQNLQMKTIFLENQQKKSPLRWARIPTSNEVNNHETISITEKILHFLLLIFINLNWMRYRPKYVGKIQLRQIR